MSRFRHLTKGIAPRRTEPTRIVAINAMFRIPKELTRSVFGMLGCRWLKVIPMLKQKTYFQQVPLPVVWKMVAEQIRRELKANQNQLNRKEKLARNHLAAQENSTKQF
jgi:hypothetical protein